MKKTKYSIVVIGAGIAGLSAIKKIREVNKEISILLITNEDRLPYKRTKINKHISVGFEKEQFKLLNENWYLEQNVDLLYSDVLRINIIEKSLQLNNDQIVEFDKLLIATGAKPFVPKIMGIAPAEITNVHFAVKVEELIQGLDTKQNFLIIGGGVEGIETADQLVKLGKKVVIIERQKNPLIKLFPNNLSNHIYSNIKKAGIEYISNSLIKEMVKLPNNKYELKANGKCFVFDEIISCAGTRSNIELLRDTGIKTNRGILVNKFMQTSYPYVFAAGDVAEHEGGVITGLWHPAEYQGINAGRNIIGLGIVYKPVPLRLKTNVFGNFYFSANYFERFTPNIEVVLEEKGEYLAEYYLKDNKIIGLVMMNNKEQAKLYQNAVANNYTYEELQKQLKA